jgi:class 3 adenylate cyclase/tetratricopeptide (TPR) repeat protein
MEVTCSNCGASTPAGFKFCGNCAAPLTSATAATADESTEVEERKIVTVLFADLAASTELAARLDPEDLRGVLRPFFEAMAEEIARYGGTVQKYIGDAVVAVFGVPAAHEDDPERAVRAALAMHRRLHELNPQLAASSGAELSMRIGVNTGEVITATGIDREGLVTGEPVNVAARFQALARPGAVVVGERTYRDTEQAIAYRSLGEVTVKGIDRPLAAWEVMAERADAAPRAGLAAPLIGRQDELSLLRLILSRIIRERRPSLVTLVGPAGIGKSRLSHEFVEAAQRGDQPVRLVRGRCLPYGDGLTYWPMAEILKADAGIMDSDPPEAILAKARARLEDRFSSDGGATGTTQVLLSSIGVEVEADPLAGAEAGAAKELIARSWRAYFENIAADRPVIALIEDLHWADPSLLDLVESLATRVAGPVLFLCPARPDLSERRPAWGGGLANTTTIVLLPLSESESELLVMHLLGQGTAPPDAIRPVLERAEGNPFFAQELLRMLIEDGSLVRHDGGWALERSLPAALPDTVQGVIASRIDLLSPGEKRAIQDAAVVGRIFWQGAVERLGSPASGPALDALVAKGLIWERESSVLQGERELIFNHVLTRDVAYASIPKSRRAQVHAQAGAWVEEVTRGRYEEFAEILAHHFERAGDPERTTRYRMLAGHRSRRVFAAEEAIRWYDRALETSGEVPDGERDRLVAEIALSRGEAREQLGLFPEAEQDYGLALSSARAAGGGRLEARALAAVAHILWLQDRYDEGQRVLPEALDRARVVGATDVLARLLYTAGTHAFGRGNFHEALDLHQEALRVAEESADREGEALAHHGLCETLYFLGPFEEALEQGLVADRLLRSLGQRPMVYHNEYMVAWTHFMVGHMDEALAAAESSVAGCTELGNRRDEAFARSMRALLHLLAYDLGACLESADRAVELAVGVASPRLELATRSFRMHVLGEVGAFDRVEEDVKRAEALTAALDSTFFRAMQPAVRAWLDLRRGDLAAADRSLEQAGSWGKATLQETMWVGRIRVMAEEGTKDPDRIQAAADWVLEEATGNAPPIELWGLYARALAASLRERWNAVRELAGPARELAERLGDRSVLWRVAAVEARAHAALGDPEEAANRRAEAAGILEKAASSITDEGLRSSFLSRPDVRAVLDGSL